MALSRATIFTIILLVTGFTTLRAEVPNVDTIDTPTAVTLPRASWNVGIWGYNNGGLLTKAIIGLHDNIYLGTSFDVESAIGDKSAKLNIPGVLAKIKLTDGWVDNPLLLAIGYDAFYSGNSGKIANSDNPFDRVIYGPYFAMTRPLFIGGYQQNLHIGIRTPIQPVYVPENTSMWVGIDFPIGFFVPMLEVERIYFDSNRMSEVLANVGFKFNIFESLSIEVDVMMAKGQIPNRMIIVEYMDSF